MQTQLLASFSYDKFIRRNSETTSIKYEESINMTAQLQQALARLEAILSRKETQKVSEKSLNMS